MRRGSPVGVADEAPWPSPGAAWYAVAVLLLAYTFAYVDRAILTILVEPIQHDLNINDTQVGLLHGFAFVIFYVTLGVPLGYLADRTSRKQVIVGSIGVWSLMTAACGLTSTFWGLFAARIGVGVGEAGLSPASYSLIADYFPPHKRSAALGVYSLGLFAGAGLAILAGGLVLAAIGERRSVVVPLLGAVRTWQFMFFVVGLPGLLIAALAATAREPVRRLTSADRAARGALGTELKLAGSQIGRHRSTYLLTTLGFSFLGVPFNVALLWTRPYLSRHFGVSASQGALIVGSVMLVAASAGIVCGSLLCDRWQARGRSDAPVRLGLLAAVLVTLPAVLLPFMPSVPSAAAMLGVLLFLGASAYGAAPASLQLITPNRMRATVSALYLLVVNLVGLTMGPIVTGALTDYVFRDKAAVSISAAIVQTASAALAALCFVLVARPFAASIARMAHPLVGGQQA